LGTHSGTVGENVDRGKNEGGLHEKPSTHESTFEELQPAVCYDLMGRKAHTVVNNRRVLGRGNVDKEKSVEFKKSSDFW